MTAQVPIEDAYAVACQALGEATVINRLQGRRIAELDAQLRDVTAAAQGPQPDAQADQ